MREVTFIVAEDEADGGYSAHAHCANGNRDLFAEGDNRQELLRNVRDSVEASFDEKEPKPDRIHLHFVRDEVIAR